MAEAFLRSPAYDLEVYDVSAVDKGLLPASNADPTAQAVANIVVGAISSMGAAQIGAQRQISEHQASTERSRIDLEKVRLEHNSQITKRGMWMEFTYKVAGIVLISSVLTAGFWVGNMGIVTHALTLVVGLLAGVGLAKARK